MLFSSISFIYYFLPLVIIAYFIIPKKFRNLVLFISSMIFYFYGEPKYVLLMLFTIFTAYIGAILIEKYKDTKLKKVFFIITLAISLGLLGIFKYSDFMISNINSLLNTNLSLLRIALPIGISFYTFQLISYVIDVYNGKVKLQKSFIKLATYVSLFPQLIAGPIVRYETVEDELENRNHSFENFSYGATRFIIGLSKKVLIANSLGELANVFINTDEKSIILYWIYGIAYSLQIYLDFSAYSDMAIGLGRIFGFHFLENFNYPYISKSITEFWRRWHISLSTWFRDYVYIPLGGNRCSKGRHFLNMFVVWALTGLWHGFGWNFIAWGLYYFVLLVLEKSFLLKWLEKIPKVFQHLYALFLINFGWVLFSIEDSGKLIEYIKIMFGFGGAKVVDETAIYYLAGYGALMIIGAIASTPILSWLKDKIVNAKMNEGFRTAILEVIAPIAAWIVLIISIAYLAGESFNPFLYFRF